MTTITVFAEMSLDGVINGQEFWDQVFKYHSSEVTKYLDNLLLTPDALLMGRSTYEVFSDVWPKREGDMAEKINSMPKYVGSKTLKEPLNWVSNLIKGDFKEELSSLKQNSKKGLLQYGIGSFTESMLKVGLVDEIRLMVFPFVIGKGPRIFENHDLLNLNFTKTEKFPNGVLIHYYHPV